MPTWLQPYLQDKRILIGAAAALVLVIILVVVMSFQGGSKKNKSSQLLNPQQKVLAQVNSYGKAIEIQALLSRQGIHLDQDDEEGATKIKLIFHKEATQSDRDKALVTLVQSGLMDKNVGLEAFDQGDLTASREEKRIKLIRAQQGELTRLIKKIDPIQDASVSIAVPEQTLFKSEQKALSTSVQVTLPLGTTLTTDKVRAITNLVVGSLQGLTADHVSISDTNGKTYNSILSADSEVEIKLQEQDQYMQQKVAAQLDRLVGIGNYVVTVSTQLREGKKETMVQEYTPSEGAVSKKQTFSENMNTSTGTPNNGGPTTNFLPDSLSQAIMSEEHKADKDYTRSGLEVAYENSRKQWLETSPAGMVEDISIAVTVDAQHFPTDMSLNELRALIANAASPKATAENVTIVQSNMSNTPLDLSGNDSTEGDTENNESNNTWMIWAGGALAFFAILILLLNSQKNSGTSNETFRHTQEEINQLKQMASHHQMQLEEAQKKASSLMEQQKQQALALEASQQLKNNANTQSSQSLVETLNAIEKTVSSDGLDTQELDMQIKSWIESS